MVKLKNKESILIIRQRELKENIIKNIANRTYHTKKANLDKKVKETNNKLTSTKREIVSLENNLNELVLKLNSLIEQEKNAIQEGDEEQETFDQQTANIQEGIDKTYNNWHTSNKTKNTNDNNKIKHQHKIAALIENAAVAPMLKYTKKELQKLGDELDNL